MTASSTGTRGLKLRVCSIQIFAMCCVGQLHAADMSEVDRNADAKLGRLEYVQHLNESFFFIDANKDSRITMNELREATGKSITEPFQTGDSDNDGTLDHYEFQRLLDSDFNAADTNKDGAISAEEFRIYFN